MNRRGFMALAAESAVGLAGCVDLSEPATEIPTDRGLTPATETPSHFESSGLRERVAGVEIPVPTSELKQSVPRDRIPAITNPAFGDDWSVLETTEARLDGSDQVIGIKQTGESRAYPLRLLNWHEVVNDRLGGPLLVTYYPLCRSGLTAIRRVRRESKKHLNVVCGRVLRVTISPSENPGSVR